MSPVKGTKDAYADQVLAGLNALIVRHWERPMDFVSIPDFYCHYHPAKKDYVIEKIGSKLRKKPGPFNCIYQYWRWSHYQRQEYPVFVDFILSYLDSEDPEHVLLRDQAFKLDSGSRLTIVLAEGYRERVETQGHVDLESYIDETYPGLKSNIIKTLKKAGRQDR